MAIPHCSLTTRALSLWRGDILKVPAGYGSYLFTKTLIGLSWQQTIWNDIRLSYVWPTLICRDINLGLTCKHPANPSSEALFQSCFLRRGVFPELKFHYGNTVRWTVMAGKLYIDPKGPSGFLTLKPLRTAARGIGKTAGNWEPGLKHMMLPLYIAPFKRQFRVILTPYYGYFGM